VDIWSLGCIFAELLTLDVLFPGRGEVNQLKRIWDVLGVPTEDRWPGFGSLPNALGATFKGSRANKLRSHFPSNSYSGKTYLNDSGFELLSGMLNVDPKQRIKSEDLMGHRYFREEPKAAEVRWDFERADKVTGYDSD
jgi:cell division cycle 2-like protein